MSIGVSELSAADIAAITGNNNGNNNDGWGGANGAWWIIILLLAFGRNGWGNGNGQGTGSCCAPASCSDLQRGFDNQTTQQRFNGIDQGLCSLGYDNAQLIAGVNANLSAGFAGLQNGINQGFAGLNTGLVTQGYETRLASNALFAQLAQCCCDTGNLIQANTTQGIMNTNSLSRQLADCCCDMEKMNMQSRFDAQAYNCNTLQAIDKLGDRIIDYMSNEKIQALRDENQALRLSASQSNQNAVLMAAMDANKAELLRRTGHDCPTAAYIVQPPTPVSFPTNCCGQAQFANFGCGCGCN